MIRELRSFWQDESGSEIVEWLVVTAILLAASVTVLLPITERLIYLFGKILDELQSIP